MDNNPIWLNDELGDIANGKGKQPTYTAQSGDNLTKIAKKYNTTVEQIAKWNNIKDPDKIKVGQVLKVGPAPSQNSKPKTTPGKSHEAPKESKPEEINYYAPLGKGNAVFGTAASTIEISTGSVRIFKGGSISPKFYGTGWTGGSRAKIKTYGLGTVGKILGRTSLVVGIAGDINGMIIYKSNPNSPNAVSPAKAGLNTGMGLYGLYVNPIGGSLYFGVDAFYPGGWQGAITDQSRLIEKNQQILGPRFNLYRDF